jgi:hypothetical protein
MRGARGGRQRPVGVDALPVLVVRERAVLLVVARPRVVVEVVLVAAQPRLLNPGHAAAATTARVIVAGLQ